MGKIYKDVGPIGGVVCNAGECSCDRFKVMTLLTMPFLIPLRYRGRQTCSRDDQGRLRQTDERQPLGYLRPSPGLCQVSIEMQLV